MLSFGVQKYTLVWPRLLISLLCYQRQCGITNPYGILGCGQSNPDIFQTQNRSSNIWSIQQIKYAYRTHIWNCFVLWTASWDSEKWEFTDLFLQGCIESIQLHFLLIFYPHLLVECMWLFLKQHFGWLSDNNWLQVVCSTAKCLLLAFFKFIHDIIRIQVTVHERYGRRSQIDNCQEDLLSILCRLNTEQVNWESWRTMGKQA